MQVSAPMRMYSTTALCSLPLHYSRALFYCTHMIIDCYTIIVMYRLQFGGAKVCKLDWPRGRWSVNRSFPAPSNPTWLFRWGGRRLCRQVALLPTSTIMCCAYICNNVLCLHLKIFSVPSQPSCPKYVRHVQAPLAEAQETYCTKAHGTVGGIGTLHNDITLYPIVHSNHTAQYTRSLHCTLH